MDGFVTYWKCSKLSALPPHCKEFPTHVYKKFDSSIHANCHISYGVFLLLLGLSTDNENMNRISKTPSRAVEKIRHEGGEELRFKFILSHVCLFHIQKAMGSIQWLLYLKYVGNDTCPQL